MFDEQNRLRRFVNSSDVRKAQISPDDVLSTDALIEKANAIASELVMNSSAFSVNTEMSAINETKADIVLSRTVSDYVFDAAVIELAQNGSVKNCNSNTVMYLLVLHPQHWMLFWRIIFWKRLQQRTEKIIRILKFRTVILCLSTI